MRWRWWRRRQEHEAAERARQAKDRAEKALKREESRWPAIEEFDQRVRDLFAEQVEAAMRRKHP
jgi:hypothetical protein